MRRRFLSRLTRALIAPWLAFVIAEPVPMHTCPMHGAHVMPAAALVTTVQMAAGMNMSSLAAHGRAQADVPDHAPAGGHRSTQCNCLGACCTTAAIALPAGSIAAVVSHVIATDPVAPDGTAVLPSETRDHRQPFANGPPA
jgi:hypothetical protein